MVKKIKIKLKVCQYDTNSYQFILMENRKKVYNSFHTFENK